MAHTNIPPTLSQDMSDFINYWHGYFSDSGDPPLSDEVGYPVRRYRLQALEKLRYLRISSQLKALAERIADKSTLYTTEEVDMGAPHGSPIRECQTCGERYSEDQVKFYAGICEDCYAADQIEESQKLEEQWQNEVRRGIG